MFDWDNIHRRGRQTLGRKLREPSSKRDGTKSRASIRVKKIRNLKLDNFASSWGQKKSWHVSGSFFDRIKMRFRAARPESQNEFLMPFRFAEPRLVANARGFSAVVSENPEDCRTCPPPVRPLPGSATSQRLGRDEPATATRAWKKDEGGWGQGQADTTFPKKSSTRRRKCRPSFPPPPRSGGPSLTEWRMG